MQSEGHTHGVGSDQERAVHSPLWIGGRDVDRDDGRPCLLCRSRTLLTGEEEEHAVVRMMMETFTVTQYRELPYLG